MLIKAEKSAPRPGKSLRRNSALIVAVAAVLLLGGLGFGWVRANSPAALSDRQMVSFLAQCIESSQAGPPRFGSDARTCENGASQVSDALSWRKFDWPGQDDPRSIPQGYLANDAVVIHGGANPVVGHLADFGDQVRRFRHFDAGQGDGGQVVQIIDGAAWGVMTEDGGAGHQWFIAPACRIAGAGLQRFKSWLFFGADVVAGAWREQVVWLAMARSPAGCPVHFSQSYTRYRRETLTVPLLILSGTRQDRIEKLVDSIVSEHFGRGSIRTADHLERFYFGDGLGLYRWERWEAVSRTLQTGVIEQAGRLRTSGRCPPLAYSTPPEPNWVMTDCRLWTNLQRQDPPWRPVDFRWPGRLDALMR